MTARRVHSVVAVVGVAVVAFLVALVLNWLLPRPWGFVAGIVASCAIGAWGGTVLYRVRTVERRQDGIR